jgi:hypothetical protein
MKRAQRRPAHTHAAELLSLAARIVVRDSSRLEPVVYREEVLTIMGLEGDDGEEEEEEDA